MTTKTGTPEDLSFLGLAHRAGAVERGTEAARQALRNGEAFLVLIARDASEKQKEKVLKPLRGKGVPYLEIADREALGMAVGRGPLTALAVTDASFASEMERRYSSQ
jgi:ribosomal protein L7Ae-like RNA K-turn-binding protein